MKKTKKLDLKGLNVETLLIETRKTAEELGFIKNNSTEPTTKRCFRKKADYISR